VCARGLRCDSTQTPYTCIVPRALGESCTSHWQCESMSCVGDECGPPPVHECEFVRDCDPEDTCEWDDTGRRCVPRRQEGDACMPGVDACARGLSCVTNLEDQEGECRERMGIDGEPCMPWGCEADHYCAREGDDLVCRPDRGMGGNCIDYSFEEPSFNSPCTEGLHCMFSNTATCLPPGGLGDPCSHNDLESCEDGLVCLGWSLSVCAPPSDVGETCNPAFANACEESYCGCVMVDDGCTWECMALLEDGERCDDAKQCVSGYCDAGDSTAVCGPVPPDPMLCLP
jgi:hypothetical protein